MERQEVKLTNAQIAEAARGGLDLLSLDDLMVPAKLARNGTLSVLEMVLRALASGECVIVNVDQPAPAGSVERTDAGAEGSD